MKTFYGYLILPHTYTQKKIMYDIKTYILKTAFNVLKLTILKYSVNPKIILNPKAGKIELPVHVVV